MSLWFKNAKHSQILKLNQIKIGMCFMNSTQVSLTKYYFRNKKKRNRKDSVSFSLRVFIHFPTFLYIQSNTYTYIDTYVYTNIYIYMQREREQSFLLLFKSGIPHSRYINYTKQISTLLLFHILLQPPPHPHNNKARRE